MSSGSSTVWDTIFPYYFQGETLKKSLSPADISYCGSVYQVLFSPEERSRALRADMEESEGDRPCVVLQLKEERNEGHVSYQPNDLFCSSCDSSGHSLCVHVAAACSFMYDFGLLPPHLFFEYSPWKTLFEGLADQHGYEDFRVQVKNQEAVSEVSISKGKKSPFLTFRGKQSVVRHIQEIFERPEETEENSIKFSTFDDEELDRYRKGRPSRRVKFALSRLCDLAQYLSLLHQMADGKTLFECKDKAGSFKISDDLEGSFVHNTVEEGAKLTILLQDHIYALHGIDESSGWKFIVANKRVLLRDQEIRDREKIGQLLDLLKTDLPKSLGGIRIESSQQRVNFSLDISRDSIRLIPYREVSGDLDDVLWAGRWVLSKKFGLFPIGMMPFAPASVFRGKEAAQFIKQNAHFLATIPGAKVHHCVQEEKVSYKVEASGALRFTVTESSESSSSSGPLYEFGSYCWVQGKGFYLKAGSVKTSIWPKVPLPPYQVSDFIRSNKEALTNIPGFFSTSSPLLEAGLKVICRENPQGKLSQIAIEPRFVWKAGIHPDEIKMYDEYAYLPLTPYKKSEEGFFSIPHAQTLFSQERVIESTDLDEWEHFLDSGLQQLAKEISCDIDSKLIPPEKLTLLATDIEESSLEERDMAALWQMSLCWESSKGKVSLEEVFEAKSKGHRFLPSNAGLLDLSQDRFAWVDSKKKKRKKQSEAAVSDRLELSSLDLIRLQAHDTIRFEQGSGSYAPIQLIERLLDMKPPRDPDMSLLNCNLRSYQQYGLQWLWYLYTNGLSGLLCDDMGVGKTHQAMALLAAVKADAAKFHRKPKFLIVCPTSLVWHWKEKLGQYVPSADVLAYFGTTRSDSALKECEVLLTTYGIWRNERKELQKLSFDVAIFDELQIAKNHSSLIWSALSDIKARMRLGLTGTPIENQLRELKALFDLILPGYMPDEYQFRELFIRPIEKGYMDTRKELLGRYVRPFILRRRKQDVLQDLPHKLEEIRHTELLGDQKMLYRSVAATHSAQLLSALKDSSSVVPYMHIFALLSSLKQISNHPATYLKDIDSYEKYESGKWNVFVELLEEAQESGLKVVVFSQYLAMLDIMTKYLDSLGIGYAQIRGQTKRRGAEISRFQNDPECKVFLGSLQAAGLGIDLTAGSIVIHYDRWWNAARENQATDRVHRIGQERGVQVYKLVTINSIEERIDQMIARKASLLEDVVSWDDHQIVKKLSRSELIELLEGLQEK